MVAKTMQYINWFDSAHWSSRVIIGNEEKYYNFKADWNSRDEYWAITISTLDDIPIIQGKKMVLGVDLLTYCHNPHKPLYGILWPGTDNQNIKKIDYDNMVNGEVKLYNIIIT